MEGWLYLAAVVDLCLRGVVGWATSANNDRTLAIDALRRACGSRKPKAGWIHHSDCGCVYVGGEYRSELRRRGGLSSMSGKGDWCDDAVAERLFASIKGECLDRHHLYTRTEANSLIKECIFAFYDLRRMHSTFGYESPVAFELEIHAPREAA